MHWSALLVTVSSLAAASAESTPYRPGVPPSPFPSQAENARVKINPDTACEFADDLSKPRNVQLAAWVECQVLAFYPYPRTEDPANTDWIAGFDKVMHPTLRASFNGTKFDLDGLRAAFKSFSGNIGKNYGTGWQQWRDPYVASPDTDGKSKGGIVIATGFNGGIPKGQTVAINSPNAAFLVVEEIGGRRWFTEYRELSTLASAIQLPKGGSWDNCTNQELL